MKLTKNLPPLTRRQRDILAFFVSYRDENGISPTLEEIARHFGLNKVTIFGHIAELERKGVIVRSAKGISRGLQLAPSGERQSKLPILGTIAAGTPIQALEAEEAFVFAELFSDQEDVYALKVRGDSMIGDAICDGDLVLVERRTDVRDGEIVVAVLPGEQATLKRFFREGDRIRLQPANPTMKPIWTDQVEVRGIVVAVVRRF